jgi:hypothetical protein
MNRMNPTLRYTQLGFAISSLIDGEEPLYPGQARQYIEDGSLFTWLGRRYDGAINLSLYEAADRADVLERFRSISEPGSQARAIIHPSSSPTLDSLALASSSRSQVHRFSCWLNEAGGLRSSSTSVHRSPGTTMPIVTQLVTWRAGHASKI